MVYNLTVRNCPEYYANGIRVHNCDAWRYGAMSRLVRGARSVKGPQPGPMSLGWIKQQGQVSQGILSRR